MYSGMTKFEKLLDRLGARYHAREGKHWLPAGATPWLGFSVDTGDGVVRIEDKKVLNGRSFCRETLGIRPDSTVSPSSASFWNFARRVFPGGPRHVRNGWSAVNEKGIMELWRLGDGRAEVQVTVTEGLRDDMVWRRGTREWRPSKSLQFTDRGSFVSHTRLPDGPRRLPEKGRCRWA